MRTIPYLYPLGSNSLVTPYWGPQKVELFPPNILARIAQGQRYVDLTAGGGGMIFHQARLGHPAHGNDQNPYAALGFSVIGDLQAMDFGGDWKQFHAQWANSFHPEELPATPGYIVERWPYTSSTGPIPNVSLETATYMDSLLGLNQPAITYSLVRAILGTFTFRSLTWDRRTSDDPPTAGTEVSPERVWQKTGRALYRVMSYLVTNPASVTGSNLDALEAARTVVRPGDVVYIDPAWPWGTEELAAPADKLNPYRFLNETIGSLVLQRPWAPTTSFWMASDEARIYADLQAWISASFESGASAFILSTQGTNAPLPRELYKTFGITPTVVTAPSVTRSGSKTFTEWFGVLENPQRPSGSL